MSLVDENPCGESERTISVGPKRGENPDHVAGKTGSAPSGLLFSLYYSVFFLVYGPVGGQI